MDDAPEGRGYHLAVFSPQTWEEFLAAGASVMGFPDKRWGDLQRLAPGDVLLCYLSGTKLLVGALEVASEPFRSTDRIWAEGDFPSRVRVREVVRLAAETGVPIEALRDRLSFFRTHPKEWSWALRPSPRRWTVADGEAALAAMLAAAERAPLPRVDAETTPPPPANAPAPDPSPHNGSQSPETPPPPVVVPPAEAELPEPDLVPAARAHEEIQWLLLKLGSDMGLDVWVARNDRGGGFGGHRFADLPRLLDRLPRQFDEVTHRTIELIDVLWLRGTAIVAAFEIESTTAIYSGLLRMADLITMQPNVDIPLYLVAPDARRRQVMDQVNRPTFARALPKPLTRVCRFLPFSVLKEQVERHAAVVRFLSPEFLQDVSESCAPDR